MAATHLALASWNRNIKMRPELVNGERFANHVNLSEWIENFAETRGFNSINFQVPILRLPAHQLIAHTAADQQRATAFIADGPSDFQNLLWNLQHDLTLKNEPQMNADLHR